MITISTFEELLNIREPIHWAMGVFDGLHLGHRLIVSSARDAKGDSGGLLGVFTFDRHPIQTLRPADAPPMITPNEYEKHLLFQEEHVDILLNLHFDTAVSTLTAEQFLDQLCDSCHVASISIGEDWHFGKGRQGDPHMLEREGKKRGFSVYVHPHLHWNGERISSTRIRKHIIKGDIDSARAMLGRPFSISGIVEPGRQLGRQLGFPTANIRLDGRLTPPTGVYAIRARIDGNHIEGIANLGHRPTLQDSEHELLLEVHLFNYSADLYGQEIGVELIHYIRAEQKFQSLDELTRQIKDDCQMAQKLLSSTL